MKKLLGQIENDQRLGGPPAQKRFKDFGPYRIEAQILHGQPRVKVTERKKKGGELFDYLLYVCCGNSNAVAVVDLASERIIKTIQVNSLDETDDPATFPYDVCASPDGKRAYVICSDSGTGHIKVFSTGDHSIIDSWTISDGGSGAAVPQKGCISPDGKFLYVTDDKGYVHKFNTGTGTDLVSARLFDSGGLPMWCFGIAITPDGDKLYVTSHMVSPQLGGVAVLTGASLTLTSTIPIPAGDAAGPLTAAVDVTPDGQWAIITRLGGATSSVFIVDTLLDTISFDVFKDGLYPLSYNSPVYVQVDRLHPNYAYVSCRSSLTVDVIDIAEGSHIYSILINGAPIDDFVYILYGLALHPKFPLGYVVRHQGLQIAVFSTGAEGAVLRTIPPQGTDYALFPEKFLPGTSWGTCIIPRRRKVG